MCADKKETSRPARSSPEKDDDDNDSEPRSQHAGKKPPPQALTMRALHLPGLQPGTSKPPFSYSTANIPPPSALVYSADFPRPQVPPEPLKETTYLIRVQYTAFTKGELTWAETLSPRRWSNAGGAIPGHDVLGIVVEQHIVARAVAGGGARADTSPPPPPDDRRRAPKFAVGEHVVALLAFDRDGAAAEFAVAEEGEMASIEHIVRPEAYPSAVAMPLSALSAYQALVEHGGVREEEGGGGGEKRVLVLGASGNVGLHVVRMAKRWGCWVVGTASTAKVDFVRDLGADEVVDYTETPHVGTVWEEKGWEGVDVIVDTVGNDTLLRAIEGGVIKEGTRVVSLVAPLSTLGERGKEKEKWLEEKRGRFVFFIVKPNGDQLDNLMRGFVGLEGFVEKEMDLADGREAMELVERGTSRGKVVLKI